MMRPRIRRPLIIPFSLVLTLAVAAALAPRPASGVNLYTDGFDDGILDSNLQPIRGAILTESGGTLSVDIGGAGQGFSIAYPSADINCLELTVDAIHPKSPLKAGDTLTWTWWVRDITTGQEYPMLESQWIHLGTARAASRESLFQQRQDQQPQQARTVFNTRKKDKKGNTVTVTQRYDPADMNMLPPAGKQLKQRWDRWKGPDGGDVVQCEIVIVDAQGMVCKYVKLFPAQDPPTFESTRLTVTANFPVELALAGVAGDNVHRETVDADAPGQMPVETLPH